MTAPKKNSRLRIGVYVNQQQATTLRFLRCLQLWDLAYQSIYRDELEQLPEMAVDVLLLHGGWYGIDRIPGQDQDKFETTPEQKRDGDAVRNFVAGGGGVIGVCCGAFNVVWLGLIPARISRMDGVGMHSIEVVNADHPIAAGVVRRTQGRTDRRWEKLPVIRMNGPILFPENPSDMVFSYDWEHRLGAVLAGSYGQGRAVAISPHPERTSGDTEATVLMNDLLPVAGVLRQSLNWAGKKL